MADTKTALKPAMPKPVVRIACTVIGCGFKMPETTALVPSIDAMQRMQRLDGTDGWLVPIAELRIAEHIVCPRCAREIRHAVPEVVFFNYLGTVAEIARRLKARAEREAARAAERKSARVAERNRGLSTAIGAFAGLNPKDGVKTEGRDGRKLVGAAADSVVRKAITKIADQNEADLREDAEKKAAREKVAADKRSALAERNSAMTLAAVAGGK